MKYRLLTLALLPALAGCATKKDLALLRTEVEALRASQAETLEAIQQQLDEVGQQNTRMRGDLTNQLYGVERQLVQIQELTGQGQQRLNELREQLRAREEAIATAPEGGAAPVAGAPEELFSAARAALERGSMTTARAGFEEFLRGYPRHERAPEAQLFIGETYEKGNDAARALEAYGRVVELYPASAQAPTALLRAGQIEAARGNTATARKAFDQIIAAYPRSPEAAQARQQLQKLPRR
jgi:tol-pal system protein YbgF